MAMNSGILESFLRDELYANKHNTQLKPEDLLAYNRAGCGLLKINQYSDTISFERIEHLLQDNNVIFLFHGKLFYADKKRQTLKKLEQNEKNKKHYNALITQCTDTYKRAKGSELDSVMSVTGRAFSKHRSNDFLSSLQFYLDELDNTDKVMFPFMTAQQKEQIKHRLRITLLLLCVQKQHEEDYQKTENKKKYDVNIEQCNKLLDALSPKNQQQKLLEAESSEITAGKPLKYLGISLAQELARHISDWTDRPSKKMNQYLGRVNGKRLAWVWDSVFLKTVLSQIPEGFYNINQAQEAIRAPDPYTGYLSWTLYYFRYSLHLSLLLKHTIKGPWMSAEEAKTPWYERFQTQWTQRKFILLNDALWGTANLVTFFWLTGKGVLGTVGDALTIGLLVFDIAVTFWDFEEQKTQFKQQILQYEKDIERLRESINKKYDDVAAQKINRNHIHQMKMRLQDLERAKAKCEREWEIQKLSLITNSAYAVGLMLAFVLLTMPFIPIAGPIAPILGIVGAALCFAFSVINNAIKGGLELYKTHEDLKENKASIKLLKEDLLKNKMLSDNEKKLLFLEIKKLEAKTHYQKQLYTYQAIHLARRIVFELCIPAVIFTSLVFLPLGGVLPLGLFAASAAIALVLAVGSKILVDVFFKPKETKELEFNEQEYKQFCDGLIKNKKDTRGVFFDPVSKEETKEFDDIMPLLPE